MLSKTSIETYFVLRNQQKQLTKTNSLNKDGSFVMFNPEIAKYIKRNAKTAMICVRNLAKVGLIKLKYIPNKNGEIRKIYVVPLEKLVKESL